MLTFTAKMVVVSVNAEKVKLTNKIDADNPGGCIELVLRGPARANLVPRAVVGDKIAMTVSTRQPDPDELPKDEDDE